MRDAQHISQEDLALYAMQALSRDESAAMREHLSECDLCRAELAMLTGDLAMVALSVDQRPLPPGARQRFAQRIGPNPPTEKPTESAPIHLGPRSGRALWMGWAVAAVFLIAAVGLAFQVSSLRARLKSREDQIAALEASESRSKQVDELLTATSAQRVLLTAPKTSPIPSGRVVYLAPRGELMLQANNLAPVPAGKAYELWVIPADGSAPVPAGLFHPDAAGNGSLVLPSIPQGIRAKAFGVTLEDATGAKSPTAPILLAGSVPASGG